MTLVLILQIIKWRCRALSNLSKATELEMAEVRQDPGTHCLTTVPCCVSTVLPFTVYPRLSQAGCVVCARWLEVVQYINLLSPGTAGWDLGQPELWNGPFLWGLP